METLMEMTYFPGCSLATSARESNESLVAACDAAGLRLVEMDDWNCCGSSSAHSIDPELAVGLCARNLGLAAKDRPLLTMCPSCFRNLLSARQHLAGDTTLRKAWERRLGVEIDPEIEIVSFFDILHFMNKLRAMGAAPALERVRDLSSLKVAAYYGCMGMFPPRLRHVELPPNLMERELASYGGEPVAWSHANRCCGTFLAATKPEVASPLVNGIIGSAMAVGAECIVTACAMCQLNLEIRCTLQNKIPILHFSEMMALVLGARDHKGWFGRHLVDPRPLLREKGLTA